MQMFIRRISNYIPARRFNIFKIKSLYKPTVVFKAWYKYEENSPYDEIFDFSKLKFKKALKSEFNAITNFLSQAAAEILNNPELEIDPNRNLSEYGLDSLDLMEIVCHGELEYEEEYLDKIKTINDIVENVKKNYEYYY
ncbi:hypothetical protein MXB_3947 [Myxobolus squamalis]|nr:hypothetical protein MXB_3947 [Myxobolus squamalis]